MQWRLVNKESKSRKITLIINEYRTDEPTNRIVKPQNSNFHFIYNFETTTMMNKRKWRIIFYNPLFFTDLQICEYFFSNVFIVSGGGVMNNNIYSSGLTLFFSRTKKYSVLINPISFLVFSFSLDFRRILSVKWTVANSLGLVYSLSTQFT